MAYEPKTWECGEIVTDSDLNRIEQGIAHSAFIVECAGYTNTGNFGENDVLSENYAMIYHALEAGIPCFVHKSVDVDDQSIEAFNTVHFVAPIVMAYKYNDVYRLYVDASAVALLSSDTLGLQSLVVFQASGPYDAPEYLKRIEPKPASVDIR